MNHNVRSIDSSYSKRKGQITVCPTAVGAHTLMNRPYLNNILIVI